jgi:peptidoglycan/xylan/chitin deacetylase (PgdA/CDA1 family)
MRVIIACAIVALSVLGALGLAQNQDLLVSLTGRAEKPPVRLASAETTTPTKPTSVVSEVATAPEPSSVSAAPSPATAAAPAPASTGTLATTQAPAPAVPAAASQPQAAAAPPPTPQPPQQQIAQAPAPAAAPPAPKPASAAATPPACPGNPDALGIERTVEIDTTSGPGFGFEHFKQYDFLKPGEVVLTFDDGPWEGNTPKVLAALAHHCVKATFFSIGKHSTYYPEILRQVLEAGHTIGTHTWSHANLNKKGMTLDAAKAEFEMGVSAVNMAIEGHVSPFFRFPALQHPPEMLKYLAERNVASFSTDMDSFDFRLHKPELVIKSVMEKLKKHGKGIILMHDFQHATAEAMPALLDQMKLNGYKIVHLRAKTYMKTLPEYDEMVLKERKLPVTDSRPTSDVVKTVQ